LSNSESKRGADAVISRVGGVRGPGRAISISPVEGALGVMAALREAKELAVCPALANP